MRVLPRVVVPLAIVGTACLLGVTGCAQFDKSLGQQQALVSFKSGTPVSERLHVRTACANLPHVTATPIASGVPLSSAVDEVVPTTRTGASTRTSPACEECVNKFPPVQGVDAAGLLRRLVTRPGRTRPRFGLVTSLLPRSCFLLFLSGI